MHRQPINQCRRSDPYQSLNTPLLWRNWRIPLAPAERLLQITLIVLFGALAGALSAVGQGDFLQPTLVNNTDPSVRIAATLGAISAMLLYLIGQTRTQR